MRNARYALGHCCSFFAVLACGRFCRLRRRHGRALCRRCRIRPCASSRPISRPSSPRPDSQVAGRWSITSGGEYFAAGWWRRHWLIAPEGRPITTRAMFAAVHPEIDLSKTEWTWAWVRQSARPWAEPALDPRSGPLMWKARPGVLDGTRLPYQKTRLILALGIARKPRISDSRNSVPQ